MSQFQKLSDDPAYAAADSKLTELKTELASAEHEREARSHTPPDVSDRERRARALLGEGEGVATVTADELTQRISDLHATIEIQRRNATEAECQAGRRIAEQIKPQYVAIQKRGMKAVKLLAEFLADEAEFSNELYVNGVRPCGVLPRFTLPGIDTETCDAWLSNVAAAYSI